MIAPQEFFSLLSDETRLRCLMLLVKEKELCVCELSFVLGSIQPKISRHLSLLRTSQLVIDERKGQWVYYRLNDKLQTWMKHIIASTFEDLKNTKPYKGDLEKIASFRKKNPCE